MTSPNAERCGQCERPMQGMDNPCVYCGMPVCNDCWYDQHEATHDGETHDDFIDCPSCGYKHSPRVHPPRPAAQPVRPLSAVLDALDAALAEMSPGPWEVRGASGQSVFDKNDKAAALVQDSLNAAGIALIRNMAASLSAAVRAAAEVLTEWDKQGVLDLPDFLNKLEDALAGVVAAAEETHDRN